MNEAETRAEYIDSKLKQSGWGVRPEEKKETYYIFLSFVANKIRDIPGHHQETLQKKDFGGGKMDIKIQKLNQEQIKEMGMFDWPIWEKEISRFDWHYDSIEECYLLEGHVIVETKDGESVSFGKGDFVIFPKGLSCTWDIKEPVKKHYNFR